jgi:hypothetical protein
LDGMPAAVCAACWRCFTRLVTITAFLDGNRLEPSW